MDWVTAEMGTVNLNDKRLNKRLCRVLSQLSKNPTNSIPTACGSWQETKAAYRLFDHEGVTSAKILEPHQESTFERMQLCPTVLLLQDTTTLSFPTQLNRQDVGPINRENTRGMFLHPTLVVTPERHCLGVLSQHCWYREELANMTRKEKNKFNYQRDLCDKESYRWLLGYRIANDYAKKLPDSQVVSITDREGDIYEIFQEAEEEFSSQKAHWLIRSHHDRKTLDSKGKKESGGIKAATKREKVLGYVEFKLPARGGVSARKVKQSIQAKRVCLSLPDKKTKKSGYKPVEVTVIVASEVNLPKGVAPLEWTLLTDLPVKSFEEAHEKLEWYLCRWQIEVYFKVLKSGCGIEKLQLSDNNFSACLSLYMIIAWRIMYLTFLGRECPELRCDTVFSQEEWQTVFIMVKKTKPPSDPPNLNSMIRMIASLGGYMNRKTEPDPGPKTLWIGMRNLQEYVKAREIFSEIFGHTYG